MAGLFSQLGSAVMYLEPLLVRSPPALGDVGCSSVSRDSVNSRAARDVGAVIDKGYDVPSVIRNLSLGRSRRQITDSNSTFFLRDVLSTTLEPFYNDTEGRDLTRFYREEYDLEPDDVRGDIMILMYIRKLCYAVVHVGR